MANCYAWILTFIVIINGIYSQTYNAIQSPRCKAPTIATHKIEKVIAACQEEIKLAILREAIEIFGETSKEDQIKTVHRSKRDLFSEEEQRIAGCLLQCVYRKVRAVDNDGFPTVEGLIKLYAEGITERGYFLATSRAVQQCLFTEHQKRLQFPTTESKGAQMCDLAYQVFDCVSDQLASYCAGE